MFVNTYEEYEAYLQRMVDEAVEEYGKENSPEYPIKYGASKGIVQSLFAEIESKDTVINWLQQDIAKLNGSLLALEEEIKEQAL